MSNFFNSSKLNTLLWGLAFILFFTCCNNKKEQLEPSGINQPQIVSPKTGTPEEFARIVADTAMINHTDLNWESTKNNNEQSAIAASSYITRCAAGNPYNGVYWGQSAPGQGNSDGCQSFAAAMAHNEYRYRKFGGGCINTNPPDWQRSPWHLLYNGYYLAGGFIWTVATPLNILKDYGCTHLTCMPGWTHWNANPNLDPKYPGIFYWQPDPQFGLYTFQNIIDRAVNGKTSDRGWSWVGNSNTTVIPDDGCTQHIIDQNQIKNALNNGRVVLLRFALVNGGIPTVTSYPGVAGPVFNTNDRCNKNKFSYHIVALLGYDDATRVYRVQNSWGASIGGMDGMGSFWMTYEAVTAKADQAAYINW